jgi:hypothetical protein
MKVKIISIFETDLETVWKHLQKPKLLGFIAKPLVEFIYHDEFLHDETWEVGSYPAQLKLFGLIPIGKQNINIEFPYENSESFMKLRDNGNSKMIKKWDHWIEIEAINKNQTKYTDEVFIEAGLLTPFVWCFASVFYNWRQFRWKTLIKNNFKQLD